MSKGKKERKTYYDFNGLNRNIPVIDVVAHYTGQTVRWGKPFHCPNPNHNDKNPSTVAYKDKNLCKCFSCTEGNGTYKNLDIVMAYYGCDAREGAKHFIEDFHLFGYGETKEEGFKYTLPLSPQEFRAIGLTYKAPKVSALKKEEWASHYSEAELAELARGMSFEYFYDEDPDTFYGICTAKARSVINQSEAKIALLEGYIDERLESKSDEDIALMMKELKEHRETTARITREQRRQYDKEMAEEKSAWEARKEEKPWKPSRPFKPELNLRLSPEKFNRLMEAISLDNDTSELMKERENHSSLLKIEAKITADMNRRFHVFVGRWEDSKSVEEAFAGRWEDDCIAPTVTDNEEGEVKELLDDWRWEAIEQEETTANADFFAGRWEDTEPEKPKKEKGYDVFDGRF